MSMGSSCSACLLAGPGASTNLWISAAAMIDHFPDVNEQWPEDSQPAMSNASDLGVRPPSESESESETRFHCQL